MNLVAFIGEDRENWGQITALINRIKDDVIVVKNKNVNDFPKKLGVEIVSVDCSKPLLDLKEEIKEKVKGKIGSDFDVSLSLASGNGKEHMALLSALLSIPVGIRIVVFTKKGVEFV